MLRFRLIQSYNPYLVCIRRTECWMYEQIVSTLFSSSWHTISPFFALNPCNPMGIGLSNCLWGIRCPPKEKHLYLILKAILWVQKAKTFKIYVDVTVPMKQLMAKKICFRGSEITIPPRTTQKSYFFQNFQFHEICSKSRVLANWRTSYLQIGEGGFKFFCKKLPCPTSS